MKKILLIYTELLDYRIPIFKEIGSIYNLTITHSGVKKTHNNQGFEEIVLPVKKWLYFRYQKGLIKKIRKGNYDAIIYFADIAWLSTVIGLYICPKKIRRVTWGLWLTKNSLVNRLRFYIAKYADSNIFYNNTAAQDFRKMGVQKDHIEVANNTVFVDFPERVVKSKRDSILVVGSFNKRKNNDVVIAAFNRISYIIKKTIRLVFVGDGEDKERIIEVAKKQKYNGRIEFHSHESNTAILDGYYSKAICAVNYGQAGLSILQSFGHGVPFVTMRNAISGGEIENIIHGFNGFLVEPEQASLEDYLLKLCSNTEYAAELGANALNYYKEHANVKVMVSGFQRAIDGRS
jgi:glycosyltransferase involved in cell wall biosynthesis